MTIYSSNTKIMVAATRLGSRELIREFYEISKLQNSRNFSGLNRFVEVSYNKANSIICGELKRFRPEFGFNRETEYYWNVNPINGKFNFSRSIPLFSISISLIKGTETVAVVIMLPISGELIWAEKDLGAYFNDPNQNIRFRLKGSVNPNNAIVGLGGINGKIFQALGDMQYRILGSTDVNIYNVLAGKMDCLLSAKSITNNLLLIREAGGSVIDVDNYSIAGNLDVTSVLAGRIKNG